MSSVWSQTPQDRHPQKLVGNLPASIAETSFRAMAKDAAEKGWKVVYDGLDATVMHPKTGEVVGQLFVEHLSPPSKPTGPDALSMRAPAEGK